MSDSNVNARAYWRLADCGGITYCDACGLARLPRVRAGNAHHQWLVSADDSTYGTHGDTCANCGESVGLPADIVA